MNLNERLSELDCLECKKSAQKFLAYSRILGTIVGGLVTSFVGFTSLWGVGFAAITIIEAIRVIPQWRRYKKAEHDWVQYAMDMEPMMNAYHEYYNRRQQNQREFEQEMIDRYRVASRAMIDSFDPCTTLSAEQENDVNQKRVPTAKFSYQFDSEKERTSRVYQEERVKTENTYTKKH